MNFDIQKNNVSTYATALCVVCAIVTGGMVVSNNAIKSSQDGQALTRSTTQQASRVKALDAVTKQYRIGNCWIVNGPFTIGQVIPPLPTGGDRPTDSITSTDKLTPQTQFAYIAVEGSVMKVQFVFTSTEVQNQLSQSK